jgi:hypothetical protein
MTSAFMANLLSDVQNGGHDTPILGVRDTVKEFSSYAHLRCGFCVSRSGNYALSSSFRTLVFWARPRGHL